MNKKQKQKLYDLFLESQKLNRITFRDELKYMDNTMDYKEEKLKLELNIHQLRSNLNFLKEQFALVSGDKQNE